MPGASEQTRPVKVLNANWTPGPSGQDGTFEVLLITDDDQQFSAEVDATALTALVTDLLGAPAHRPRGAS